MKSFVTAILTIVLLLPSIFTYAQDEEPSKEIYKKWKDIARDYKRNPMELRDKFAEYEKELSEMKSEIEALKSKNEDLRQQQLEMEQMVIAKEDRVKKLEKQIADMEDVTETPKKTIKEERLAFYVQIGAYEKFNINHYFEGIHCMNVQLDDNLNKYVIGSFSQVSKATDFRNDIRKMGIEDAWVVSRLNGERIPMKDALQLLEQTSSLSDDQLNYLKSIYSEE